MQNKYKSRGAGLKILNLFALSLLSANLVLGQAPITPNTKQGKTVIEVIKHLSNQYNISSLTGLKEVYAFNLRIVVERKLKRIDVLNIVASDSIGYRIFPNYKDLKNIDYRELLSGRNRATLVIPVLILNKPFESRNPDDSIKSLTKKSLTELASALVDDDFLDKKVANKDITLSKVFVISRSDIPKTQ